MVSIMQRMSVAVLLFTLVFLAIKETSGNPGQEQHDVNSVADAIRYLQDLENRHQFARPRSRSVDLNTNGDDLISDKAYLIALLENIHENHSRTPRFGKRGNNEFMSKEFTNNYLRYLLENPPEGVQTQVRDS